MQWDDTAIFSDGKRGERSLLKEFFNLAQRYMQWDDTAIFSDGKRGERSHDEMIPVDGNHDEMNVDGKTEHGKKYHGKSLDGKRELQSLGDVMEQHDALEHDVQYDALSEQKDALEQHDALQLD